MKTPLISIITPCYNGEKFLGTYFNSLFNQTYSNFELIIVNDGSKDQSDRIITQNIELLRTKGHTVKYINYPLNEGLINAVNHALLRISGEFFSLIDVDDLMHPDYIEKKVTFLLNNPDTDMLITPCDIFDIVNRNKVVGTAWKHSFSSRKELIHRFIYGIDSGNMPGAYMMKTETFYKFNHDKQIYNGVRAGTNIQIVFPFICLGVVRYMDCKLYDYYLHPNNLHTINKRSDFEAKNAIYKNVVSKIGLNNEQAENIMIDVDNHVKQLLLGLAFNEGDTKEFHPIKKELLETGGYRNKDRIKSIIISSKLLFNIYKFYCNKRGGV